MNATATGGDGIDIDLHDTAAREEPFQFPFGGLIRLRVAEFGGDHRAVADVEVDVASGEVVRFEFRPDMAGRSEYDDLDRTALGVGRRLEDVEMAHSHVVVEGLRIRIESGNHHAGAGKAGIEVGVAVGDVLAGDTR